MPNPIVPKKSSTPGAVPTAGQLLTGEIAANTADGKLFIKKSDGTVAAISGGVSDGNKGDVTVSGSGATWTINAGAVTTSDLADGAVTISKTSGVQKTISVGTSAPSGGASGDIYLRYSP